VKILVVEDDPDQQALFQITFEHLAEVTVYPDVYQSLAAIRETDFDVVVLDLMMPGANGIELLSRLEADGNHVPVVVVSSMADNRLGAAASRLGACAVLSKAASRGEIVDAVLAAAGVDDRQDPS
jgi:two-component system response regulator PfeR